jgi:hypothetical protein
MTATKPQSALTHPADCTTLDARRDTRNLNRLEDGMADFTPYQQKIIKRYYDNQDTIQAQRLAELVSELYLSTGKKRQRAWAAVMAAMQKLGIPQARIDHLHKQDNPALVAEVVKELEGKK